MGKNGVLERLDEISSNMDNIEQSLGLSVERIMSKCTCTPVTNLDQSREERNPLS